MGVTVGLIVNPVAGRDVRRLVSRASLMSNQEKAAICRRVLEGLAAVGVERVWAFDDGIGILRTACDGFRRLPVGLIEMETEGTADDSVAAARACRRLGTGALVTLGGDGTNRAVAQGCGEVPLVAVSTGTNNVFPTSVDGTIAGMAAGLVAAGAVPLKAVARQAKRVEVTVAGEYNFALIDAALSREPFVAGRAIWEPSRLRAIVFARAEPWAVGLSSIGGRLRSVSPEEPAGLYLELGNGPKVLATLAPGLVTEVGVAEWRVLKLEEAVELPATAGTLALDGERELTVDGAAQARVCRSGPLVVDIRAALAAAHLVTGEAPALAAGGEDG